MNKREEITGFDQCKKSKKCLVANPEVLQDFSENVGLLWTMNRVDVLEEPPYETFHRDYVSRNVPCIIRNLSLPRITLDHLAERYGDLLLTVDTTPDGHGDCIRQGMFVKPMQQKMALATFRTKLRQSREKQHTTTTHVSDFPIIKNHDKPGDDLLDTTRTKKNGISPPCCYYYSLQNDCLRTEWKEFYERDRHDLPDLEFASRAFGSQLPDAMNIWIGDERVVSSTHKDHYENMYWVWSGEKLFTLYPPADAPFLSKRFVESGEFVLNDDQEWAIQADGEKVPWIDEDKNNNLSQYAHPIQVRVQAGETLYLPSLWFHRVTQTCETVAGNSWFDMRFDSPLWCYFSFLQQLQLQDYDGEE